MTIRTNSGGVELGTFTQEAAVLGDGSRNVRVRFWGVRGSCPAPLSTSQLQKKILLNCAHREEGPIDVPHSMTYGGNTTCVEVQCDGAPFILDLGMGLRLLGKEMMRTALRRHGCEAVILQSHLHMDHLMGLPFFAPLFLNRREAEVRLTLVGGAFEGRPLSEGLRSYMRRPFFPIELRDLERGAVRLLDLSVVDGFEHEFTGTHRPIRVLARRVQHPDETFGYRITYQGVSVAFTTDHEPVGGGGIPHGLLELVNGADLWITDCQYSHAQYLGDEDGCQRFNWGHSYPEYIASVAKVTRPKRIVTTHHDPDADDERIYRLAQSVRKLSGIPCEAAYEGLIITLDVP